MRILIIEPYFTGSHADWAREYAGTSTHTVEILSLEGRHWKWRMHGGAVSLARRFLAGAFAPDLIIASDMLDLTTFLALTRERTASVKTAVYFHENQLSYPWPQSDPDPLSGRDAHYGFINYASALAADAVLFNSRYHYDSFMEQLAFFLDAFPDHTESGSVRVIREKARVLSLGIDLQRFDRFRSERDPAGAPLILWNHRWEYDKNPNEFFEALYALRDEGIGFEVAVLGERFSQVPPVFTDASSRLGDRVVQFGFVEDFSDYAAWLWRADILPVTSLHDFFGVSVVQGIYCNCYPLLPKRLAYPEHIPEEHHGRFFYDGFDDLLRRLRERIDRMDETRDTETGDLVRRYDWRSLAPHYDELFEKLCGSP